MPFHRLLCVAFALSLAAGCSGGQTVANGQIAASLADLAVCETQLTPYDLTGRTADGLDCLNDWLALTNGATAAPGHRLRADTLLDLWVLAALATDLGWEDAQLLRSHIEAALDPLSPDSDLANALTQVVDSDLLAAGANDDEKRTARELVAFDLATAEAASTFGQWQEARSSGSRLRLILAYLVYREGADWLAPADAVGREEHRVDAFFRRFSWLCGATPDAAPEVLAGHCGYWCTTEAPETDPDQAYQQLDGMGFFPTRLDPGYELVAACGPDYFGLPETSPGSVVLLNESNFLDLVFLGFLADLMGELEDDLMQGDPLIIYASDVLALLAEGFLSGSVSQDLTPAVSHRDMRLQLPILLGESAGPAEPALRQVVIQGASLRVANRPSLHLGRDELGGFKLEYVRPDYHYPGRVVTSFSHLNRLDAELVVDGRLPVLEQVLGELETTLAGEPAPCGHPEGPVQLLIDGSIQVDSLIPTLASLVECGYPSVQLMASHAEDGLNRLPVTVAAGAPVGPHHEITVQRRHFRLRVAQQEGDGVRFGRGDLAPIRQLRSALQEAITANPTAPVVLRAEDGRMDYGMLVNLIAGLAWQQPDDGGEDDLSLLETPLVRDFGQPLPLAPQGLFWVLAD